MTFDSAFKFLFFNDCILRNDDMRRFPNRQRNQDPRSSGTTICRTALRVR